MSDRFEKFTERARKVLTLAQEEAQRFNHTYIGTEHFLAALVREKEGIAGQVLSVFGIEIHKVRSAIETGVGRGERLVSGSIGLTPTAKQVIDLAIDEAQRLEHRYIGTEHLLLSLLRQPQGAAAGIFASLGIDREKVREAVNTILAQSAYSSNISNKAAQDYEAWQKLSTEELIQHFEKILGQPGFSSSPLANKLRQNLQYAEQARNYQELLQRLASQLSPNQNPALNLQRILLALLDCIRAEMKDAFLAGQDERTPDLHHIEQHLREQLNRVANELQGRKSSTTRIAKNLVGKSMLEMAREGQLDPLVGRVEESQRLVRILNRRYNPHALLVGEDGVGKSALVKGLVLQIAGDDAPPGLESTDIIRLELDDFADYVLNPEKVYSLSEAQTQGTLLFIPHFDRLLEFAVKENRLAVLYYLFTHLATRVIATTTPAGYERIRQMEITLANRFQPIPVKEPDEVVTLEILKGLKARYEHYHELKIEDSALEIALFLSQKYLTGQPQPARALDVLDEACSLIVNRREEQALKALEADETKDARQAYFENLVTDYTVTEVIASITGKSIPEIRKELFS